MNIPKTRQRFLRNFARDELRLSSNARMSKILSMYGNITEEELYSKMEDLIVQRVQRVSELEDIKKKQKEVRNAKRREAYAQKKTSKKQVAPKPIIYEHVVNEYTGFEQFKSIMNNYRGKTINVSYNGLEQHVYDVPSEESAFKKWIRSRWFGGTMDWHLNSEDLIWRDGGVLKVSIAQSISPTLISQSFAEGETNCMLTPILNWAKEKLDEAKSTRSQERYRGFIAKIYELLSTYTHGVPQEKINEIANYLQVSISVELPFQSIPYISEKPQTKSLTSFRFLNMRHDHVDCVIDTKQVTTVNSSEMNSLINKYDTDGTDYYYLRSGNNINYLYANGTVTKLINKYSDFVSEFETKTGVNEWKIDAVHDQELTRFVNDSTHYNCCMDFDNNYYNLFTNGSRKFSEVNHIDQSACYRNFKSCKYYSGFLGKITDFRYTNKIESIGIYLIKNLVITNPIFKRLNDELGLYVNNNAYPSPALTFLNTVATYEIVGGCWGMRGDLDMDWENESGSTFMSKDENGVPYYSKYVGACNSIKYDRVYYLNGDKRTAEIIRTNTNTDVWRYSDNIMHSSPDDKCMIEVRTKKHSVKHLSHVTSFVLEYARLRIIEQLMCMEFDSILRVNSDGIYYVGKDVVCKNNYRPKPSDCFNSETGMFSTYTNTDTFCSNTRIDGSCEYGFGVYRPFFKNELAIGGGGSGKTHFNLMDNGLVNIMYIAPTWKLARNKAEEYKCKVGTHASLLMCDPTSTLFNGANVLLIDEVSMMSNEEKNIIMKYYHDKKLIFCGDINYQLPFVLQHKKGEHTKFTTDGFDNIMHFDVDHRAKCNDLKQMKIYIRELIDLGVKRVEHDLLNKFKSISHDDIKSKYDIHDMVLCSSHKKKDEYTTLFKDLKKYYITKTTNKYACGEIVITDDVIDKEFGAELRHAYTVHSIQGETCNTNLFIEGHGMDMRMFYTAVSRAKYMDQIFIVQ